MTGPFTLAPLPFGDAALEPAISSRTLSFHYYKHHQAYVDTLNALVEKTKFADMKLEKIIQATVKPVDEKERKIFDNAAQVWNHDFYWRSLSPAKTKPSGDLAGAIARDFGSTATLIAQLAEAGKNQFGSGWAWLVSKDGKLSVEKTSNAMTPMAKAISRWPRPSTACSRSMSGNMPIISTIRTRGQNIWKPCSPIFSTGTTRRRICCGRMKRCAPPPSDRHARR
jgi:superoxide dismutase, Fe-Mn family